MVPFVRIESVSKSYPSRNRRDSTHVLRDVSLNLHAGESVGLVGESGAGKSTLGRLILGLERPDSGRIFIGEKPVSMKKGRRDTDIPAQMVWQDPGVYLNPYFTVAELILEPMVIRGMKNRLLQQEHLAEQLDAVALPLDLSGRRPHELSGGQCQRVAIARALSAGPELLICDEPLAGLDIPNQVHILKLLSRLQTRLGLTCLFICHDLWAVKKFCNRVAILKEGRIVESGDTIRVLLHPEHAYTKKAVASGSGSGGTNDCEFAEKRIATSIKIR